MYFKEPGQLMAVYGALEESNLFYIQNAQETEEALEELRAKYRDTKARLDGKQGSSASREASTGHLVGWMCISRMWLKFGGRGEVTWVQRGSSWVGGALGYMVGNS